MLIQGSLAARIGAFEQHANAFAHFAGGFIGKRDGENRAARNALLNQVGDTIRDDARLASARARQDKDWPIDGEHSLALLGIQVIKNIHLSENLCWFGPCGECILAERIRVSKPAQKICFPQVVLRRNAEDQCVAGPRSISKKNRGFGSFMKARSGTSTRASGIQS